MAAESAEREPWPKRIVEDFALADREQIFAGESAYYAAYCSLLFYLFSPEDGFVTSPQCLIQENVPYGTENFYPFTVSFNYRPVFFIEVRRPVNFEIDDQRKHADDQMRSHFRDFRPNVVTPRLPAISAFGTRLCFYEYTADNNSVLPPAIPSEDDQTSAGRWSCDLFDADGIAGVRQVAQDVRKMCQALDP